MDREIIGTEAVLPSRGLAYNGNIKDGKVLVSPMTTREEKALASSGNGSALNIVDLLIGRCVHGMEDMKPGDLLVGDRLCLCPHVVSEHILQLGFSGNFYVTDIHY